MLSAYPVGPHGANLVFMGPNGFLVPTGGSSSAANSPASPPQMPLPAPDGAAYPGSPDSHLGSPYRPLPPSTFFPAGQSVPTMSPLGPNGVVSLPAGPPMSAQQVSNGPALGYYPLGGPGSGPGNNPSNGAAGPYDPAGSPGSPSAHHASHVASPPLYPIPLPHVNHYHQRANSGGVALYDDCDPDERGHGHGQPAMISGDRANESNSSSFAYAYPISGASFNNNNAQYKKSTRTKTADRAPASPSAAELVSVPA